jgi:hypothetical protein
MPPIISQSRLNYCNPLDSKRVAANKKGFHFQVSGFIITLLRKQSDIQLLMQELPHMTIQFTVPTINMVPAHFVSLANMKAVADSGAEVFCYPEYSNFATLLRDGVIPSLRVSSFQADRLARGQALGRTSGQVYFDPKYATAKLVGQRTAAMSEEVGELSFKPANARSKVGLAQIKLIIDQYRPAVGYVAPEPAQGTLNFIEPTKPIKPIKAVEINVVPALKVNDQKSITPIIRIGTLFSGMKDTGDLQLLASAELLAATKANTLVMEKLLACWA